MWGELFKTLNYSRGIVTSIAKKQFCRKKSTYLCHILVQGAVFPLPVVLLAGS